MQEMSFADEVAHRWIKHFTLVFLLMLVLRVLFFIFNPEWGEFGSKYWYYLSFAALMIYVSITGYSNTIRATLQFETQPPLSVEKGWREQERADQEKQEDSLELEHWRTCILQLFEQDQVYENQALTLTDVARLLSTNRTIISLSLIHI